LEEVPVKKTTLFGFALLVSLSLILSACGGSSAAEPTATTATDPEMPASTEAPEAMATEEMAMDDEGDSTGDETAQTFVIISEESEARFFIDEVLAGSPNTVVGVTSKVEGQLTMQGLDAASAQISTIRIAAGDLTTDNNFRNGALHRFILQAENYPYIEFTPTSISGAPENISVGQTIDLQITGDLKIRDVTQEVTFEATVTAVSETRLEGSASAVILYPDFDISIPEVSQVASVEDEVLLEIDFMAVAE
jgi:polyisoprenoid-binding protein YceI